jgi:hypothetical protein
MNQTLRSLLAATVGGLVVATVVVGQPALAEQLDKAAAKNSVTSKSIKNGTVKAKDLNAEVNGSLAKANSALQSIPDNGVTNPKLADNAVGSAEVAADSLGSADLANSSVGNGELVNGSVTGAKVVDGTLKLDDISLDAGTVGYDPPNLAAGQCTTNLIPTGENNIGDFVFVQPNSLIDNGLSFSARVSAADIQLILVFVCNETGGAVNSGAGSLNWFMISN